MELVEAGHTSTADGGCTSRLVRPHLDVVIDISTLAGGHGDGRAETATVGRVTIPSTVAHRLAGDSPLSRVVMDGPSVVLDYGRRRRTVPPGLRRYLELRDQGCRFPGCDRPSPWTDAHHLAPWQDGGPTSADNLVLLCRRHHRLIHTGRFTTRGNPEQRTLRFHRRSGDALPPPEP